MALEKVCPTDAYNWGIGRKASIVMLARLLADKLYFNEEIKPTYQDRAGDIIHRVADMGCAREILDFEPDVASENGIIDRISWSHQQETADKVSAAVGQLADRDLLS